MSSDTNLLLVQILQFEIQNLTIIAGAFNLFQELIYPRN